MNRVVVSKNYANKCQEIIQESGDDYRIGSEQIEQIGCPPQLHPMLVPIYDLAYEIADNFRGEDDDKYYWNLIKAKVTGFLENQWEQTAWLAMVMYGIESDGAVSHSYSVSVKRRGTETTYESGNEDLHKKIQEVAGMLDTNQTDEWFICSIVNSLPETINGLRFQSVEIAEIATEDLYVSE